MPYITVRSEMALTAEQAFQRSMTYIEFNCDKGTSDKSLSAAIESLSASPVVETSYTTYPFCYKTDGSAHLVLDTLEDKAGYKVVASNIADCQNRGKTHWQIWTLHKQA